MEVQGKVAVSREVEYEDENEVRTLLTTVCIQYVVATKKDDENVLLLYEIRKKYYTSPPLVGTDVCLLFLQGYPKSAKLAADIGGRTSGTPRPFDGGPRYEIPSSGICSFRGILDMDFIMLRLTQQHAGSHDVGGD
jgi:hypothetical protein